MKSFAFVSYIQDKDDTSMLHEENYASKYLIKNFILDSPPPPHCIMDIFHAQSDFVQNKLVILPQNDQSSMNCINAVCASQRTGVIVDATPAYF